MAGHHPWSPVQRLTTALDPFSGQRVPSLAEEITTTANFSSSDSERNARLRGSAFRASAGGAADHRRSQFSVASKSATLVQIVRPIDSIERGDLKTVSFAATEEVLEKISG